MSREVKTLPVAAEEEGIRLDRWIRRRWPHVSHIQVQKLARSGQIRVDGSRARPEDRLAAGSMVRVPPIPEVKAREPGQRDRISPRDAAYARSLVIFEDEMVIVLNKPHGLAVQGGTKTTRHVDALLSAWGEGLERPRLVHRLDRDTTGVLLLGKGPEAAKRLSGAFARRQAKKTYWALVSGTPKPVSGRIELALKKSGINDYEIMRPADAKEHGAETAETAYATVSRAGQRVAWLALRPFTGRTHQLRAHMKSIGHPILGDPKYGDETSAALSGSLKLQLHARRIELDHPGGGKLIVEAPLSPEMKAGFENFGFVEDESDFDPFAGDAALIVLAVFDIDGTLVDSRATILSATRTAARAMGLPEPDYEVVRGGVGLSLTEAMARLAPDLGPDEVDRYTDHYKAAFVAMHAEPGFEEPLYAGAMDLLADLKRRGWRLSLATGQSRRGVARNLARAGWADLFASSHCAEDGPGKPHPAMLQAAITACKARPEQTIMIGDTGHDMRMARGAGVWAQGVGWGFHTEAEQVEAGAHHVAASFDDLTRQLETFAARQRETT